MTIIVGECDKVLMRTIAIYGEISCPICSMYDIYVSTKLGDFVQANVGKYSGTMEHM